MNTLQISQNINFQAIAATKALELISDNTGISFESLLNQFANGNKKLMSRVAEMVIEAAKITSESINK